MGHRLPRPILASLTSLLFIAPSVGFLGVGLSPSNSLQTAWEHLVIEPGLVHSSVSAYAYDLTTGKVLAAIHPDLRQTPASVTKLFTSAAALSRLGPAFTYQTMVKVGPSTGGMPGPIYLVGGGDPWLEANGSANLQALAATVAKQIRRASQVIGVSSLFTAPRYGMGWPYGDIPLNDGAGTTALMAERNEIFVTVTQASAVGLRPSVRLLFNAGLSLPSYFEVINQATTGKTGSRDTLSITRRMGTNQIVVRGALPLGASAAPDVQSAVLSVGNPARFAASLFQNALAVDGVQFSRSAAVGVSVPKTARTIASHRSAALSHYLQIQNQFSINQMAENLYRELGVSLGGSGSLANAAKAMAKFSAAAKISSQRVQVDGSGLSPFNEASAKEVVQLLSYASRQPWFATFRNSLMHLDHVNNCGFLCPPQWSYGLPRQANLWVKTGNLSNQWNYAGYAKAGNGNLIAFAILDDGTPTRSLAYHGSPVDQMMEDTAFWPNVPPPGPLAASDLPQRLTPTASGTAIWASLASTLPAMAKGSLVGVSVENVLTGKTVFAERGNTLIRSGLLPRLVLADALLSHGPTTSDAAPTVSRTGTLQGGILHGQLVLDGHHDPAFRSSELLQLAEAVKRTGIDQVGGLEYVNPKTGFQASRWPNAMPWNDFGRAWTPPSSNLVVNQDQASLQVVANSVGERASVSLVPRWTPVAVQNETTTTAKGPSNLSFHLKFGTDIYVLTGSIVEHSSQIVPIAPPDPGYFAALSFRQDLAAVGVTVNGPVQHVTLAPPSSLLATTPAPTKSKAVSEMLHAANISAAQSVASVLGPKLWSDIGKLMGASPNYLVEPTGVAADNYLTPRGVTALLTASWKNPADAPLTHFLSHSLWRSQSPEEYDVAGYLTLPNHETYAVCLMISGLLWNHHFTANVLSEAP